MTAVIVASDAPTQEWRILRRLIPKKMQPLARGARKRLQALGLKLDEPYRTVFPFTQCHEVRQRNLVRLCERIDTEGVEGAIVECGVLDGGTAALMAWATRNSHPARPVHLFDAWKGLPETTPQDGDASKKWTVGFTGNGAAHP